MTEKEALTLLIQVAEGYLRRVMIAQAFDDSNSDIKLSIGTKDLIDMYNGQVQTAINIIKQKEVIK